MGHKSIHILSQLHEIKERVGNQVIANNANVNNKREQIKECVGKEERVINKKSYKQALLGETTQVKGKNRIERNCCGNQCDERKLIMSN